MSRFQTQSLSFPICQMRIIQGTGRTQEKVCEVPCMGASCSGISARAWLHVRITWEALKNDQAMSPSPDQPNQNLWMGAGECQARVFFFFFPR